LKDQLSRAFAKYGSFYPRRENFHLTGDSKQKSTEKIKSDPRELGGRKVGRVVRTDGLKLVFEDGSWVCYRLSGTEPVVRIYSEARSADQTEALGKAAQDWAMQ
jgi:phosphoglucomutase